MFLVGLILIAAHGCFNDFEYAPSYFTAYYSFLIGYHYTIAKVLF
jgi:hypothetical protein